MRRRYGVSPGRGSGRLAAVVGGFVETRCNARGRSEYAIVIICIVRDIETLVFRYISLGVAFGFRHVSIRITKVLGCSPHHDLIFVIVVVKV
jgi:hypothetical protein